MHVQGSSSSFAQTGHAMRLLQSVAVAVQQQEPALLVGETGTGKTTLVQRLANQVSPMPCICSFAVVMVVLFWSNCVPIVNFSLICVLRRLYLAVLLLFVVLAMLSADTCMWVCTAIMLSSVTCQAGGCQAGCAQLESAN